MIALTRCGRGLGVVELDRWDNRNNAHDAAQLFGSTSIPDSASLSQFVFVPPEQKFADQGPTQACVGWAIAQLIHVRACVMGLRPICTSPMAIYLQARAKRYGWNAVTDSGCNPHDALASLREVGIVPYSAWPHCPDRINITPPPDAYRKGADKKWLAYSWVLSSGTRRVLDVARLIAEGRPVGIALRIDDLLESWVPSKPPWKRTKPAIGGHMMAIVGFHRGNDGRYVFNVANSWGPNHDNGLLLLDQAAIESNEATYAVTVDIDCGRLP